MVAAAAPFIEAALAGSTIEKARKVLNSSLGENAISLATTKVNLPDVGIEDLEAMVETAGEFEELEARLQNLTGSTDNVKAAMQALQAVAGEMPFRFQQVSEAFINMTSLGLEPSERALKAFGDMAKGLGKRLNDVIQAIGDAANGKFGGLEKLGITAKAAGDEVTFTFNGVATTVKNNSEAIQGYLRSIAENNFAGAMANHMDTVQTKFGQVNDAVDRLVAAISNESGLTAASKEAMSWMSETANFSAKVIEQEGLLAGLWISLGKIGNDLFGMEDIPPKIETTAQAISRLKGQIDSTKTSIKLSDKEITAWGKAATDLHNSGNNSGAGAVSKKIQELGSQMSEDLKHLQELEAKLKELEGKAPPPEQDRLAGLTKTKEKADQSLNPSKSDNKAGVSAACPPCAVPESADAAESAAPVLGDVEDPLAQRLESVQNALATENEKLREHYEEQEFIVEEAFQNGLINDEERKTLIEELETQHKDRLLEIEARSMSAQEKLWQQGWEGKAQVVSSVLGSLSQLMNSENKKQFEIGKKAAIAQAVIDTYLGAQRAYSALAGIVPVGPALGAAAAAAAIAAGMARVNAIKSQSFGGGGGGGASASAPSLSGASGGSASSSGSTSAKEAAPPERQRVFVEFQGNEDSKMTARQWREFMRNLQEEAGDAQLEF